MSDQKIFGRASKDRGDGWRDGVESLRAERQRRHGSPPRRSVGIPLPVQVAGFFVAVFSAVTAASYVGRQYLHGESTPTAAAATITAEAPADSLPGAVRIASLHSGSVPICSGGDRAARKVTCIVDGDTGWLKGEKWRLTSRSGGVDAPEISKPECANERALGDRSRDRLRTLMASGYSVGRDGADRYDRTLVTITLADGRDAGEVLIAEGLAQEWPNSGNPWCGR